MIYDIRDYGAIGDGITDCTTAIQNTIDTCNKEGGGIVLVSKGTYRIGTIYFKSNVIIDVEIDGKILAQTERKYYPDDTHCQLYRNETHMDKCLFFAKDCTNIGVQGRGTIDGNGAEFSEFRPMMFRYLECQHITVKDITLRSPASWTHAFIGCENIWVDGIDIKSRANGNGDGLDFDGCENVFVSNCKLDCSDDCICLQNSYLSPAISLACKGEITDAEGENLFPPYDKVCKNIVVTNCNMSSRWAGMRIGLLSCGPIELVTVSNCIFQNIDCSGLKIQSSEGSSVSQMTFTNLIMKNVQRPILMTANRFRERIETPLEINTPSYVGDMTFSHIVSDGCGKHQQLWEANEPSCIVLDCDEGNVINNITLTDIHMKVLGDSACPYSDIADIPTHFDTRAEAYNYKGTLPASGIFARNITNLSYQNVTVKEQNDTGRIQFMEI